MGFTIGGMRDIRERRQIRESRSGARRGMRRPRARMTECTVVAEYTGLWGWDVVPGVRAVRGPGGRVECCCAVADCPLPGRHPLDGAQVVPAGATLHEVVEVWGAFPDAVLMLPLGRAFDVIEVPESAGRRALVRMERMGLPCGPVAVTPHGRCWFLVAPGAAGELPHLLYRMGWDDADLDLHGLGLGDHVLAPPSDLAGLGPVHWLRAPTLDTAGNPPPARLLVGTLAYACHRVPLRG